MIRTRYEIIETNENLRDEIMSRIMSEHLMQGIAYFCLIESQRSSSPEEMTTFMGLSDVSFTERFCEAVVDLEEKGLIRKAA